MLRVGAVAHRLEQAAHNHLVAGSIPASPTRFYIGSRAFIFLGQLKLKMPSFRSSSARRHYQPPECVLVDEQVQRNATQCP